MTKALFKIALIGISVLFVCACPRETRELRGMEEPTLTVHLYPEGQDADVGIVEDGVQVTLGPGESNGVTEEEYFWPADSSWNYVQDARVLVYLPERHDGNMILMCPGGGYGSSLTTRSEGLYAAWELTRLGHPVALLIYRMPNGHHIIPLRDAQNAMRYLRRHSAEWGVSRIGVMGGSAGGHLAASVSTLYEDEITRPDFTILDYAALSFDPQIVNKGCRRRLTGGDPALDERYSAEKQVTPDTPPALIFHSADDKVVGTAHSEVYFEALRAAGVEAQLHIFPRGGHGWGFSSWRISAKGDPLGPYREIYNDIIEAFLQDVQEK